MTDRCTRCGGSLDHEGRCGFCLLALGLELTDADTGDVQSSASAEPRLGEQIGPYTLSKRLGEGGMGVVFLAEQQQPLQRRVALKVIKSGLDSREVLARFATERRALALMDHPNIARALEAGSTADGRPYFAMELVEGAPITEYCDRRGLGVRQRLLLFLPVCRALQHAHQRGILHRDIKPSNVLVEIEDDRAVPKVIDFGVAKALESSPQEATRLTRDRRLIGTPAYMSPEQADGSSDLDTTTDVYALGVLLYELLTGDLPFDPDRLREAGTSEMLRILREELPERPSVRVARTSAERAGKSSLAGLQPLALARQLRGDLDWIVLAALEKDRAQRYQSASDLAADVERHLAHQPVLAGPRGAGYRARKFVRRHRAAAAAAAVLFLGLAAAAITASWGMVRARTAEIRALHEAAAAEQVSSFLVEVFSASSPALARGTEVTARELLDRGVKRLERDLRDQPEVRARLLYEMARVSFGLGLLDRSKRLAEEALALRTELLGPDHLDTLRVIGTLGSVLRADGRYAESEELLAAALERAASSLGEEHPFTVALRSDLALAVWRQSRFAEAAELFAAVLETRRRRLGNEHPSTLASLNNLANVYMMQNRADAASSLYSLALEASTRVRGRDHPATLDVLNNLAWCYASLGRYEQAEPLYQEAIELRRKVLGPDHLRTLGSTSKLAVLYLETGRAREAEEILRETLDGYRRTVGPEHPSTLWTRSRLAQALQSRGAFAAAEKILLDVLEVRRRILGSDHYDTFHSLRLLGGLAEEQERWEDAERWYRAAVEAGGRGLGEDDLSVLLCRGDLGRVLDRLGRSREAEELLASSAARLAALYPSRTDAIRSLRAMLEQHYRVHGKRRATAAASDFSRVRLR